MTYFAYLAAFLRKLKYKTGDVRYLYLWFISAVLLIVYIVPMIINPTPFGTDTYTHLYHVTKMSSTFSMKEYYDNQKMFGDKSFTYPFGLWLFGSIIHKITGLNTLFIGKYTPIFFILMSIFIYYSYSKKFLTEQQQRMLMIIFLISTPLVSRVNTFVSSTIGFPFLIALFHFLFNHKFDNKITVLFFIFTFMMIISHVGTLMFFINFLFLYFILNSFVKRRVNNDFFFAIILTMTSYYIATFIFNEIRPQYISKSKMVLKIGNVLSKLNLEFLDISKIIYENVFKNTQLVYFLFLFGILYFMSILSAFIGKKMYKLLKNQPKHLVLMPLAGKVPKTLVATPIWIGIPQAVFSIFGLLRINSTGKLILITTFIIILVSGSDSINTLRMTYYLIVIIPILSAIGFSTINKVLQKRKPWIVLPFIMLTFTSLIIMSVIYNAYFSIKISGELYEKDGLTWLSKQGKSSDAVAGPGFRHFIYIYGKKVPAYSTIAYGSELKYYFTQVKQAYFSKDPNPILDLLASYNVKYYLISERSFKVLPFTYEMLKIENNSLIDKVYSNNNDHFRVYIVNYVPKIQYIDDKRSIEYKEAPPLILDAGKFYLIRTKNYQIKLGEKTPFISYFGTKNKNYLGSGFISDYILWRELGTNQGQAFDLQKLQWNVSISKNSIKYTTHLFDNNMSIVCKISLKYIFFSNVIKQEITILPYKYGEYYIYTSIWKPTKIIITQFENRNNESRRVFPADDSISRFLKFNKLFLKDNSTNTGIFIYQEDTFPYFTRISYKGSITYPGYAIVSLRTSKQSYPYYPEKIIRYFTLSNSYEEGEKIINNKLHIQLYPYPYGIKPLLIYSFTKKSIKNLNNNLSLKYYDNLDNNTKKYIIGPVIKMPYKDIINYEGHRKIRIVNNKVIIPICGPTSDKLKIYNKEKYFSAWKSQIDVLKIYDTDICVFDWKSDKLLSEEYIEDFRNLINYAISNGFTIINPNYISNYYKQLNNLKLIILKNNNSITQLKVINNNNHTVNGITIKILNHNNFNYNIIADKKIKTIIKNKNLYIYFNLNSSEEINLIIKKS